MALAPLPHHVLAGSEDAERVRLAIVEARAAYYEEPAAALEAAIRCHEIARSLGSSALRARALALQGAVSVHRGDLRSALALVVEAERLAEDSTDATARSEVAALKAQVSFFTGSYAEALSQAELAIEFADSTGDLALRIYARRSTCVVLGNVDVRDWRDRLEHLLELSIESGDLWEQVISRNDLACYYERLGDLPAAEREIHHALDIAHRLPPPSGFALAVVHSTRADIRLLAGQPQDALADAERAIALLVENGEPNPYVLGVTVRADVQARMALGHLEDAQQSGEGALTWLGDRVPQTRSVILLTLATALRDAGRTEDAYDALSRAAELERQAFRELSELQLSLERATLETRAARRESDSLAAKNRQLAEAHAELERRTRQLEALQEQLHDQANRDWLTGLYNRRYLARELERSTDDTLTGPLSLAVLDLDHFKAINDRFGHAAGDDVLVRVARLLCDVLRTTDIIVRSGGEEFLVVMPMTGMRAAVGCCERIRDAIREDRWDAIAPGLAVTTSIGVAATHSPGDLEALVKLADQRLYEAKRAGRDCVVGPPRARAVAGA